MRCVYPQNMAGSDLLYAASVSMACTEWVESALKMVEGVAGAEQRHGVSAVIQSAS